MRYVTPIKPRTINFLSNLKKIVGATRVTRGLYKRFDQSFV